MANVSKFIENKLGLKVNIWLWKSVTMRLKAMTLRSSRCSKALWRITRRNFGLSALCVTVQHAVAAKSNKLFF